MIEIPVHNQDGKQIDTLQVDEQLLGGSVRYDLLKQAFVRYHANKRQGNAKVKSRSEVEGSTRKLYRQKGTGNARAGDRKANIRRGGGVAMAKRPRSFRKSMPAKMRRLANRNSLLAKLIDNEVKLVDSLDFDKPSTKQFDALLNALEIDRSCLLALADTSTAAARSARNIKHVDLTQIDRLNAFDLLNHRYVLADKAAFAAYIEKVTANVTVKAEAAQ